VTDALWTTHVFRGRRLEVAKTGAVAGRDCEPQASAASRVAFDAPVRLMAPALRALRGARRPSLWFAPDWPGRGDLIWAAAAWGGVRIAERPSDADPAFCFADATRGHAPTPRNAKQLSFGGLDVSKRRVAAVFEQVFGYSLALDPARSSGYAIEKSEVNGLHDSRIVRCPLQPKPARVYQRIIENIEDDQAVDLQTLFIGGKPVVVFVARRPKHRRFDNCASSVSLARPEQMFSTAEIARLQAFAEAMKLEWGGLDVLRDRFSNRIYVASVNKTGTPPRALPWRDKLRAVSRLGRALRELIEKEETR